ncbi:PREDICTED: gamma-secretase subunit APH-1A isoform X1 [Ceratotherium simum simum]|uniref:Gamma-secretase subunit APH-1 n=1 Tax=Ceratotherium simum simum TaxID=73337 RepID=A0ABM1D611_CERSS|nr:PREDICTED: gamma-secretase subunit APH-1A isoform X1 [Ceratotherium simum simum]
MGAAVFFGCTFVAFGPAFALFLITVAGDPLRVIILVAGAFFWLVSLLLASVVWFILVHVTDRSDARLQYGLLIFGAAVSVLLQEVFRFAYYKLLKKADEGLASLSEDGRSPISIRQMAYVSGLSFGIISGVFSVINILADALGPGVVGIHGDSPYYFLTSDIPEPLVRGQPAAHLCSHCFHGALGFHHSWRVPPKYPAQPLVPTAGGQSGDGVFCPAHPTRGLRDPGGDPWAWGALLISSPCISPSPVLDSAGCQEKGPSLAIAVEMKLMEAQG